MESFAKYSFLLERVGEDEIHLVRHNSLLIFVCLCEQDVKVCGTPQISSLLLHYLKVMKVMKSRFYKMQELMENISNSCFF